MGPGNTRSAKTVRDPNTTPTPASAGQTRDRLCGEAVFFPWGPPGGKAGADWRTAPSGSGRGCVEPATCARTGGNGHGVGAAPPAQKTRRPEVARR